MLFKEEEESRFNFNKIELIKSEFPLIVVEQLLNAMKLNSYEARQRFPRLLQIVELYNSQTIDAFINSTSHIPCWMFLGWLSQMTALLAKPESRAIFNIVLNIANEYPQAFVYPFRMSMESFKFDYTMPSKQQEFISKLKIRMHQIPLANQFIASLEQLTNPNMLFKDYYEEINKNLKNRDQLLKILQEMYVNLIDCTAAAEDVALQDTTQQVEWGVIRKNFSKFLKPHFETEFGEQGKNITSLNDAQIVEKVKVIGKLVQDYAQTSKEGNLGEYSPWLRNFKRNIAKDLEIPGS